MKIMRWRKKDKEKILSQCERILKEGGVVVGPSDTVYGIYANARNTQAVRKIFEIKKRAPGKALPVFVESIVAARRLAFINERTARFLARAWPGAVTAVFRRKAKFSAALTGSRPTIGIRIPDHPFLLALLSRVRFPLVETSANISGDLPLRSLTEIKRKKRAPAKFAEGVALWVDGGMLSGAPSAVIDFSGEAPVVLRNGAFPKKELDRLVERWYGRPVVPWHHPRKKEGRSAEKNRQLACIRGGSS